MPSETVKINFEKKINDRTFKFKNVKLDRIVYEGGVRYYSPMGTVSSIVRQYVKQRWPQLGKFNIASDSYSMGDSVTVFLNFEDKELFDEISTELTMIFQRGNFNGMEDIYEYSDKSTRFNIEMDDSDDVTTIDTKWMSVNNKPKFGSTLWKEAETKGLV